MHSEPPELGVLPQYPACSRRCPCRAIFGISIPARRRNLAVGISLPMACKHFSRLTAPDCQHPPLTQPRVIIQEFARGHPVASPFGQLLCARVPQLHPVLPQSWEFPAGTLCRLPGLCGSAPSLRGSASFHPWWSGWMRVLSTCSLCPGWQGCTQPIAEHGSSWVLLGPAGPSPAMLMFSTALIWAGNEWFSRCLQGNAPGISCDMVNRKL